MKVFQSSRRLATEREWYLMAMCMRDLNAASKALMRLVVRNMMPS